MKKTIFAALAAVTVLAGTAGIAEAKTKVQLYIGTPFYDDRFNDDYGYYPDQGGYYVHQRPRYDYYRPTSRRMSCNQARNIVRDYGYRSVVARDCNGRSYSFSARRNGKRVIIYLDSRTGAISRG
jgi:hypothetical protein